MFCEVRMRTGAEQGLLLRVVAGEGRERARKEGGRPLSGSPREFAGRGSEEDFVPCNDY
jgi:hypothetical protein